MIEEVKQQFVQARGTRAKRGHGGRFYSANELDDLQTKPASLCVLYLYSQHEQLREAEALIKERKSQ